MEANLQTIIQSLLDESKARKFTETVEMAINLKDVDMKNPKNRIDEEIVLPKGRGKTKKIAVFGSDELAAKAKECADMVISPEDIEELRKDKKRAKRIANSHAFFLAAAPLMPVVGKNLGVVLGPRGKMPKPIPPSADPAPMVTNLRNSIRIRSKDSLTFHAPVGSRSMSAADIEANIKAVMKRVLARLERGDMNIRSIYLKTTMGDARKIG